MLRSTLRRLQSKSAPTSMSANYTFRSATTESAELTPQDPASPVFATAWKLSAEPSQSPATRAKEPSASVSYRPRCQRDHLGERAASVVRSNLFGERQRRSRGGVSGSRVRSHFAA